jgi:hypothetical protein
LPYGIFCTLGRKIPVFPEVLLKEQRLKEKAVKNKETAYQQVFLFGKEGIWDQLPPKVQEKALGLCARMVIELFRRAEREVKTDAPENHL